MNFEIKKSKNGKWWFFVLKGKNNEIIATSEMYSSKQMCKKGITAVRKAVFASVKDLTK